MRGRLLIFYWLIVATVLNFCLLSKSEILSETLLTISTLPLVISLKDLLSLAAGKSHPKLSWLWLLSGHNFRLIVSAVGVFVISSSEDEESSVPYGLL